METVLVRRLGAGQAPVAKSMASALPVAGAVTGGILGGLTGAVMGLVTEHLAIGVGIGLLGGGVAGYYVGKKAEAAASQAQTSGTPNTTQTGGATGGQNATGGQAPSGGGGTQTGVQLLIPSITLASVQSNQTITVAAGQPFIIYLPANSLWTGQLTGPMGGAAFAIPSSGSSPASVTAPSSAGTKTIRVNWQDSTGLGQTTMLTIVTT